MKIKTTSQLLIDSKSTGIHSGNEMQEKWVRLKDLIQYLNDFPSIHYSSLTVNRECADKNVRKIIDELNNSITKDK